MNPNRIASFLLSIACLLGLAVANPASARSSTQVLLEPTETQIVLHVEAEYKVTAAPDFEQVSSYQSGEPHFWEGDLTEIESPSFGDGSPGLRFNFYTGRLEQAISVFIPNKVLRRKGVVRIDSDAVTPPDDVNGVDWNISHPTLPMSLKGTVIYDGRRNVARVSVTFVAGTLPPAADQIDDLIEYIGDAPGIDARFESRLITSLRRVKADLTAGRTNVAALKLAALTATVELARAVRLPLISGATARAIVSDLKLILVTLHHAE